MKALKFDSNESIQQHLSYETTKKINSDSIWCLPFAVILYHLLCILIDNDVPNNSHQYCIVKATHREMVSGNLKESKTNKNNDAQAKWKYGEKDWNNKCCYHMCKSVQIACAASDNFVPLNWILNNAHKIFQASTDARADSSASLGWQHGKHLKTMNYVAFFTLARFIWSHIAHLCMNEARAILHIFHLIFACSRSFTLCLSIWMIHTYDISF